jgi:hypothetical protein
MMGGSASGPQDAGPPSALWYPLHSHARFRTIEPAHGSFPIVRRTAAQTEVGGQASVSFCGGSPRRSATLSPARRIRLVA